jgi:uncharacterized protein
MRATTASIILILAMASSGFSDGGDSYRSVIDSWREKRETSLKSDTGWLTVAGLFWLKEGQNRIGTDRSNELILPAGSGPGLVGTFEFNKSRTQFKAADGVNVQSNGERVTEIEMSPDTSDSPTLITAGDLSMIVIKRGERYGIRLRDKNSKYRKSFRGLHWYPVKESYRIEARFIPYDTPKKLPITNVLGDTSDSDSPGYLLFNIDGKEYRFDAEGDSKGLFINFKDLTSGKTTYPAGRFLYTDAPKDGRVVLDFNKAVNPPCAFTPYATCPLPPQQNRLQVAIEAGEMNYHLEE